MRYQNCKFVSAESGYQISIAHRDALSLRNDDQRPVALGMTVNVIDVFESV